jgi:cytoskeletal protein RodZ
MSLPVGPGERIMHGRRKSMGVGRRLRQARMARGMSLAELGKATKIPTRLLEGLEAEQYELMPAGIFGRGYVRAVAHAVGLDGNELAHDFGEETAPAPVVPIDGLESEGPRLHLAPDDPPERRWGARTAAAVLLVISVVLVILWLGRERPAARGSTPVPPASRASTPSTPIAPPRENRSVGTTGVQPTASSRLGALQLAIEASRPCWVVLTVDGERVIYRLLQAGEHASTPVKDRAVLHAGDAAALAVRINGRKQTRIGPAGEARTVEITPAGGIKPLME